MNWLEQYKEFLDLGKFGFSVALAVGIVVWMAQQMRTYANNIGTHLQWINTTIVDMKQDIQRVNRSLERHVDHSQELRGDITGRIELVEKTVSTISMRKGDKRG